MTGAQLPALVRLRWQMVRAERVRVGLLVLAACVPGLLCAAVIAGQLAPRSRSFDVTVLGPTAFLGFAVLSLVAPLAAGGGNELFPPEQLVAYPIRPATHFFESLLVAPLNLAWMSQFVLLFGMTSFVTGARPGLGLALVTTLVYVAMVTVAGQMVAWMLIGARQSLLGRRAVWALTAAIVVTTLVVLHAHLGYRVLDNAPTKPVVSAVLAGGGHRYFAWASGTTALGIILLGCLWCGPRICAWALRRPGDRTRFRESRVERRRPTPPSPLATLVRVDRANVWRAAPLRRGLLVLAILPGVVAASAALRWDSLVLLPALVAAGAGLLYGVNMFCLDAGGATWLASLPSPPRLAVTAKTIVLGETIGGSCLVAAIAGSVRAAGPRTAADLVAMACCLVSCTAVVLATCLRLSIRTPHRAELRGHRDTPAPPAAMAVYSVRLATVTTLIGLLFSLAAHEQSFAACLVLASGLIALSGLSIAQSFRRWDDPSVRSRIVAAVSNG
ncbi:MAG TPA: hypothetical protein VII50_00705 [Acidothermaceae bacterium]